MLVDQEEGPDIRLVFDAGSHLMTRLEFVFDPKMSPEGETMPESVTWTAGQIATEAPKDAEKAFTFAPADGVRKVETFAELVNREDEPDPAERLGRQARARLHADGAGRPRARRRR